MKRIEDEHFPCSIAFLLTAGCPRMSGGLTRGPLLEKREKGRTPRLYFGACRESAGCASPLEWPTRPSVPQPLKGL
jgi:hypothetical protein